MYLAATLLALAGCSEEARPTAHGHLVVAVTLDWEGIDLGAESVRALDQLRARHDIPLTHFVSAAYFTHGGPAAERAKTMRAAIHAGDELAMHLHGWQSLVRASGVTPKLAPSFLTGTDELVEIENGEAGIDTDLDTYEVVDLRAMLRTSRQLLEQTGLEVSTSFRAGGYLGTPKVLRAAADEGFTTDSSATDYSQFGEEYGLLGSRVRELWPRVTPTTQPFQIARDESTPMLEMPIAAIMDNTPPEDVVDDIAQAAAALRDKPDSDVFVVLGFHFETAPEHASEVGAVIDALKARPELAKQLYFTTLEHAASFIVRR